MIGWWRKRIGRWAALCAMAGAAGLAVGLACGTPQVSLTLRIPSAERAQTKWIEVAVLPGGCLPPASLAGGIPESGPIVRLGYAADGPAPELGLLPAGSYGFASVARRDDCGVVATGCSVVDVTRGREVTIDLSPTKDPDAAKCSFGGVCNGGRCLPPSSTSDPAVGEGCSMQFMGAGPLPNALAGQTALTAPAIVATPSGFLIGYGEFPAVDGSATCSSDAPCLRANLLPLDSGGGAKTAIQKTLDGYCAPDDAGSPDPAGLSMTDAGGLLVFTRPACQGSSGLEQLALDPEGAVKGRSKFLNGSGPLIQLSTHALVPAATAPKSLVALRSNSLSGIFVSDGTTVTNLVPSFGTSSDRTLSMARGTTALGILVHGVSGGGDAGPVAPAAKVYVVPAGSDPKSLGAPVDQVPSTISAVAASGARVFVASDSAGAPQELGFSAYDLGKAGRAAEGTFTIFSDKPLLALDAAATKDHLFVAVEQAGNLSIAVIDSASSATPTFIRRVDFATDARIPASYKDGAVSITATDSRVAITWVSRRGPLQNDDTTGGYAIFACK